MKLITTAKAKLSAILNILKTSERVDRLETATFEQLDSSLTRIEELEYQIDYLKKQLNGLESRVDYVEEMDISDAVETEIREMDMSDYVDIDSIADIVLAAIAERLSEGVTR